MLDNKTSQQISEIANLQRKFNGDIERNLSRMQQQVDAIDLKSQGRIGTGGNEEKSLADLIVEDPAFQERKEAGFSGNAPLHLSFKTMRFPA